MSTRRRRPAAVTAVQKGAPAPPSALSGTLATVRRMADRVPPHRRMPEARVMVRVWSACDRDAAAAGRHHRHHYAVRTPPRYAALCGGQCRHLRCGGIVCRRTPPFVVKGL